jgi:hypothetical protein
VKKRAADHPPVLRKPRPSKTALFAAAVAWDPDAVRQVLAGSRDLVTARDARGRTALHLCAGAPVAAGRADVAASVATARALLGAGAELDSVHEISDGAEVFRATPLWYALARGRNSELARVLLKAGASPDHCLWTVIWTDEPELVRLLLRAGSRTDVRFDGETPLIYAARLARVKPILELLAAGADVTARDGKGRSAADHGRRKRLPEAVLAALGAASPPHGRGTRRA